MRVGLLLGVTLAAVLTACGAAAVATAADTGWPSFGNDAGNSKYSPLAEIDADNFDRVRVVWTWESVDTQIPNLPDSIRPRSFKAIPVVIDGRMYVSTPLGQVAAIDAASGKPLWSYDPQSWEAGRAGEHGVSPPRSGDLAQGKEATSDDGHPRPAPDLARRHNRQARPRLRESRRTGDDQGSGPQGPRVANDPQLAAGDLSRHRDRGFDRGRHRHTSRGAAGLRARL